MQSGMGRSQRVNQLRGLAALAVVACHLGVSAYKDVPNVGGTPWPWLGLILGFGYLGVPLFFVISGFCIHLPQARMLARGESSLALSWRSFFARRFWRLYPPYVGALVFALVLVVVVHGGLTVPWSVLVTQALLVQTFHPSTFDGINPPAWSLAVEAQLYLAYPVVFWLIARRGALRALAMVLAVTLGYRLMLSFDPLPAHFGGVAWEFFLARWFEWVLGAVVAEWAVGRVALPHLVSRPWPAVILFGLGMLLEWRRWQSGFYVIMEPIYGVAFALLLCVLLRREPRDEGSPVGRYLAGVGLYSYSLYLLHRPIQLALEPLAARVATWPSVLAYHVPSSLLIMAALTPLVLLAARVFHRYCEAPAILRAEQTRPRRAPTAPGLDAAAP